MNPYPTVVSLYGLLPVYLQELQFKHHNCIFLYNLERLSF